MSKKGKVISAVVVVTGCLALAGSVVQNNSQANGKVSLEGFGKVLKKEYKNPEEASAKNLYAKGNYSEITKTDMEKSIAYYKAKGMSEEEAEKEAYKYEKESAALCTEAMKAGCEATDKEVADYVSDMRAEYEGKKLDESSQKQVDEIIAQFDSPEDYWKYEKTVYQKLLPQIKYREKLEKEYSEKHAGDSKADWGKYFDNYRKEIVEKEDFKLVK